MRIVLAIALLVLGSPLADGASAATLAVANKAEATLSLVDLASGEVVATLPTGAGPHEVGVSPDGRFVLVTNYGSRGAPGSTLTLVDVAAARVVRTIDLGEHRRPHGVAWLDADRALVTAEDDKALLEIDVARGKVARAIETGQEVSHMVAAAAESARAFVANIGSGSVTAIDLAAGAKLVDVATGDGAEGIALARGGRELWVTNRAADTLTVLDAARFSRLAESAAATSRSSRQRAAPKPGASPSISPPWAAKGACSATASARARYRSASWSRTTARSPTSPTPTPTPSPRSISPSGASPAPCAPARSPTAWRGARSTSRSKREHPEPTRISA